MPTVNDAQLREGEGGGDIIILGRLKIWHPRGCLRSRPPSCGRQTARPHTLVFPHRNAVLLHDALFGMSQFSTIVRYRPGSRFAANEATSKFPQEAPYLAELPARRTAEMLTLACAEAMLEIAVASTRRSARAFRTTMHPTAGPPPDGRLSAGPACPGPGAAAGRPGQALDVGLTHGVVCQFLPPVSRSSAALTMPTIPLAPECI
jgi:hypothetical protein